MTASLAVAPIAFAALWLGFGIALLVLRGAAADVIGFLESAFVVAAHVALVRARIDEFAWHVTSPSPPSIAQAREEFRDLR
jgi:hypothetical protein